MIFSALAALAVSISIGVWCVIRRGYAATMLAGAFMAFSLLWTGAAWMGTREIPAEAYVKVGQVSDPSYRALIAARMTDHRLTWDELRTAKDEWDRQRATTEAARLSQSLAI